MEWARPRAKNVGVDRDETIGFDETGDRVARRERLSTGACTTVFAPFGPVMVMGTRFAPTGASSNRRYREACPS
jgi:hypothetical protein